MMADLGDSDLNVWITVMRGAGLIPMVEPFTDRDALGRSGPRDSDHCIKHLAIEIKLCYLVVKVDYCWSSKLIIVRV